MPSCWEPSPRTQAAGTFLTWTGSQTIPFPASVETAIRMSLLPLETLVRTQQVTDHCPGLGPADSWRPVGLASHNPRSREGFPEAPSWEGTCCPAAFSGGAAGSEEGGVCQAGWARCTFRS